MAKSSISVSYHVMSWKASLLIMGLLGFLGLALGVVIFLLVWHFNRKQGR
jgi:hypothetical protein